MDRGVYLAKGCTMYEFITLKGDHMIIKYKWGFTDELGRKLSKSKGDWYPVNLKTDERYKISDRLWKATRTSKEMGNSFYRDLRSVGYRKVNKDYRPNPRRES